MAWAVSNRQAGSNQLLAHVFDVGLLAGAKLAALTGGKDFDGGQAAGQYGGGQGGGEDEARAIGADHVNHLLGANNVATHVAVCFA